MQNIDSFKNGHYQNNNRVKLKENKKWFIEIQWQIMIIWIKNYKNILI